MLIDIHNHVMPAEALDVLRGDPGYGVTIEGDQWTGVHHVPFTITAPFHDPAAKIAELEPRGIASAVVSCPPPLFCYEVSSDRGASFCAAANDGMAKFCAGYPDRLRWLANLPMQDPPRGGAAVPGGARGRAAWARPSGPRSRGGGSTSRCSRSSGRRPPNSGRPVLVHPAFNQPHAGAGPVLPAERHRQPAGDHHHGGADDLRRGVRPAPRCGSSCCTAAASCPTRRAGWRTPAAYAPRSR